jgi:Ca2+:H+ antiporter
MDNTLPASPSAFNFTRRLSKERTLFVVAAIAVIAYALEHTLVSGGKSLAIVSAIALILAIVGLAVRITHHAEVLAEKVGDPYGSMILTLSAVLVEVVILAIVMGHSENPALAKSTIFSALMIDINLILGLAALAGGLKHGEQIYNDDSGRVYTVMILVAVAFSMILPNFIPHANWKTYSMLTIAVMVLMYAMFLRMQTKEHSYFFHFNYTRHEQKLRAAQARSDKRVVQSIEDDQLVIEEEEEFEHESTRFSAMMLVAGVIITGFLAEVMAMTMNVSIEGTAIPPIFMAMLVAGISASPEILTAVRAAMANRYQNVINISLGAALSTVILTIPVVEAVALFTGQPIDMGLTTAESVMILITLIVAWMNVADGEANAIEGMTHVVLFIAFIALAFLG